MSLDKKRRFPFKQTTYDWIKYLCKECYTQNCKAYFQAKDLGIKTDLTMFKEDCDKGMKRFETILSHGKKDVL